MLRMVLTLLFLHYTMNIRTKENRKLFTYKFIKFTPLKPCPQEVIDIMNPNKQQVLNEINPEKLTNEVFLLIIDLFQVNKFDDVG